MNKWFGADILARYERVLEMLGSGRAVTSKTLAASLDVSQRTVYRDIEILRTRGYRIEGSAGCGYLMRSWSRKEKAMTDAERESIMRQWDSWRVYIARGGKGSWPRDAFEALLDTLDVRIEEAQQRLGSEMSARSQAQAERYQLAQQLKERDGEAIAYLHEIEEPGLRKEHVLSLSADNPWAQWLEQHRGQRTYKCTPLYARGGKP